MTSQRSLPLRHSKCLICGAELSIARDGLDARVCRSASCQWTYRTTPRHRACAVCGRPLSDRELVTGVCSDANCRRDHAQLTRRKHDEEISRQRAARLAAATALRDARAPRLGIEAADEFIPTPLPGLSSRVTRLSAARRSSVRAHLTALAAEARRRLAAGAEDPPLVEPAMDPAATMTEELAGLLGQGCARCRGQCCSNGGDHRYIRVDAVARYMSAHSAKSDEAIVEDYMARIGERSFEHSCVYHGAKGCTLPREMRSNICNTFYCAGLSGLRDAVEAGAPARTFFFTTNGDNDVTGAFVDARAIRVVRRRGGAGSATACNDVSV